MTKQQISALSSAAKRVLAAARRPSRAGLDQQAAVCEALGTALNDAGYVARAEARNAIYTENGQP
jgi:hypothetical protein